MGPSDIKVKTKEDNEKDDLYGPERHQGQDQGGQRKRRSLWARATSRSRPRRTTKKTISMGPSDIKVKTKEDNEKDDQLGAERHQGQDQGGQRKRRSVGCRATSRSRPRRTTKKTISWLPSDIKVKTKED